MRKGERARVKVCDYCWWATLIQDHPLTIPPRGANIRGREGKGKRKRDKKQKEIPVKAKELDEVFGSSARSPWELIRKFRNPSQIWGKMTEKKKPRMATQPRPARCLSFTVTLHFFTWGVVLHHCSVLLLRRFKTTRQHTLSLGASGAPLCVRSDRWSSRKDRRSPPWATTNDRLPTRPGPPIGIDRTPGKATRVSTVNGYQPSLLDS